MTDLITKLEESKKYIVEKIGSRKPELGIVLGSGLGGLGDEVQVRR